jgi:hypothetical protein
MTIRGYIEPNYGRGKSRDSRKDRRKRQDLFNEQQGKCHWCSKPMQLNPLKLNLTGYWSNNNAFATFEHILPRANGGTRAKENIVLAHASCNRTRHRRKWPHDPYRDHWDNAGRLKEEFTNGHMDCR